MMKNIFKTLILFLFCSISYAQFTEGFNTGIPAPWKIVNQGGDNTWLYDDGEVSLRYNSEAHDDYLITAPINVISGVSDLLKFSAKNGSSLHLDFFDVLLSQTGNNISDFTVSLATDVTPDNDFEEFTYDLSAYTGSTVYIAIHATSQDKWRLVVDDFINEGKPSCSTPTNLAINNISATMASLSWTASISGETAWEYTVQVLGTGAPSTNGTQTNSNTINLTGLLSSTDYKVYVRSVCPDGGYSSWSDPITFATPCTVISSVYKQDFSTDIDKLKCWSEQRSELNGTPTAETSRWTSGDYLNNGSNTKAVKMNIFSATHVGELREWLVSPEFDLSGKQYELAVKVGLTDYRSTDAADFGSDDEFKLLISEDNGTTWTALKTWNVSNSLSNSGEEFKVDLQSYNSQNVKFAFYASNGDVADANDIEIFVDDFEIKEASSLGTSRFSLNEAISLVPNPTVHKETSLKITTLQNSVDLHVNVYTITGQKVKSMKVSNAESLNFSDLPSGTYILEVATDQKMGISKIIVD